MRKAFPAKTDLVQVNTHMALTQRRICIGNETVCVLHVEVRDAASTLFFCFFSNGTKKRSGFYSAGQ